MTSPHFRLTSLAVLAGTVILLGACGSEAATTSDAGALSDGDRVEVEMTDLAFDPSEFEVARGATVTFVFDNTDTIDHEALIGDETAQGEHEAEMMDSGGDMGHEDGGADSTATTDGDMGDMGHKSGASEPSESVLVAPGESAEITYTFDETGDVLLGCHQPGHYDGGMVATITVS